MIFGYRRTRAVALCLAVIMMLLCAVSLSGCAERDDGEITVVCTVFPIYDWTRQVVGSTEGVNVILLVDNGGDAHSFQPTAKDAIAVRTADLVVRAGGSDDGYVEELVKKGRGVDLRLMETEGITLHCPSVSSEEGHGEHHGDDRHDHGYDGHIWLSLKNAAVCVDEISDALSQLMPEAAESFRKNAEEYRSEISALDGRYREAVSSVSEPRLVVADRFPFVYLTGDYGIAYEAAFEGCTTDAEASFDTVLRLAKRLNGWGLSVLVMSESGDARLAETVAAEAQTECRTVILNSMQSVGAEESGIEYLDIMEQNLEALMSALRDQGDK